MTKDLRVTALVVAALSLGLVSGPASAAQAAPAECAVENGATQVTADCIDSTYSTPVIDAQTEETSPVPHHRIRGHFEGTNIQFTIYLHAQDAKQDWQGRFFQYTYPVTFGPGQDTSQADDRAIGFALESGGYAVQAGNTSFALGYRHAAAAAKFAREVAAEYYQSDRPIFGYLYGPSGGSFQTIGAAENSTDVWQGFVPLVQGVPNPTSYNFMGRSAAELILSDKSADIQAALLPGGSGDPYATLDDAQTAMLKELHLLGVPWQGWEWPDYLLGKVPSYFGSGLDSSQPIANDPTYVDDFWNTPGYLGAEQSPLGDRVRAKLVEKGDTLENRWNIANRFYYRYNLPPADAGWIALDQFRDDAGAPMYPQRSVTPPPTYTVVSGNASFDGAIRGKVIVVDNLYDPDALPIHADWYRQRVQESLGAATNDQYRIYYNDHADHQDASVSGTRAQFLVNWYGIAEQALRDMSAWVEDGVAAPSSTEYTISDSQVVVPSAASARHGLQPTVDLKVDGGDIATVAVGAEVELRATAQTPPQTGRITKVEWDLDGDGTFEPEPVQAGAQVSAQTTTSYASAGTRLVAVKVTSQREGQEGDPFALVQNIDRVQVVVRETDPCETPGCVLTPGIPTLSGNLVVGSTLAAEAGQWGPGEVELSYQWLADGQPIPDATGTSFRSTTAQLGARISVAVTGTRAGYVSATATSAATEPLAAPPSTPSPSPSPPTPTNTGDGEQAKRGDSPGNSLAATGISFVPATAIAVSALLIGTGLVFILRRRTRRAR